MFAQIYGTSLSYFINGTDLNSAARGTSILAGPLVEQPSTFTVGQTGSGI